ncbi:monothiol glutaredoxin grx5 [Kappamyces sp. JEL0829]|nr:monothiol glutaredoxin grx5 [Kappamyces sp. JEL0829]
MKGTQEMPQVQASGGLTQCGFSRAVMQILELQGVEQLKTVNILEDAEMRAGIKEYNNWPTIPQVFIKGEFVGGTDIMLQMHKDGSLEDLLIKEGIVKDE